MNDQILEERATEYARLSGITLDLKSPLGNGQDGRVWKSHRKTAVKVLERERNYLIERECYQQFKANRVVKLQGFSIPQLVEFNDDLCVIEMGIVAPPFILDFAKSHLDQKPDYDPEVIEQNNLMRAELFGRRWPQVQMLIWGLRAFGIYYQDAKPGNIEFGDEDDDDE